MILLVNGEPITKTCQLVVMFSMAQQRLTTPIHLNHLLLETGPSVVREEKRSFSALCPHKEAAQGQYSPFLSAQQVKSFSN